MKNLWVSLQKAFTFLYVLLMLIKFSIYTVVLGWAQKGRTERVILRRKWYLQNVRMELKKYWRMVLPTLQYLWKNQKFAMFLIVLIIVALFLPSKQKVGEPPDTVTIEIDTSVLHRIAGSVPDLYRFDLVNDLERKGTLSRPEMERRAMWLTLIGSGDEMKIDSLAFHDSLGVAHYYESSIWWDTFYVVATNPFERSRETPYEAWDEDFERYGAVGVATDTLLLDSLIKLHGKLFDQIAAERKANEQRIAKMRLKEQERKQQIAESEDDSPAPRRRKSKQERIEQYVEENWEAAVRTQQSSGIPASITLAQAIIEGNAGFSPLAVKYHNHFGVKCGNRHGSEGWWSGGCKMYPVKSGHCVRRTDDDHCDKFRIYRSRQESFNSHASLLTQGRYIVLFKSKPLSWSELEQSGRGKNADDADEWWRARKNWKNPRLRFVYGLDALGYATDPDYADKLLGTIEDYDLGRYDEL